MITLACRDAGVDCDFVAKDETVDGVIRKAVDHVKSAHPDKAKGMASMTPDEMKAMLMSMVKDM